LEPPGTQDGQPESGVEEIEMQRPSTPIENQQGEEILSCFPRPSLQKAKNKLQR
jgi:hypothetical protein